MLADRIEALLADKGYDADAIRAELAKADVEAVIPAKSNRRTPIPHDREKYRWRNLVERLFNKLKNWRRVATRYDKTAESYLGFVAIASVTLCNALRRRPLHPTETRPSGLARVVQRSSGSDAPAPPLSSYAAWSVRTCLRAAVRTSSILALPPARRRPSGASDPIVDRVCEGPVRGQSRPAKNRPW